MHEHVRLHVPWGPLGVLGVPWGSLGLPWGSPEDPPRSLGGPLRGSRSSFRLDFRPSGSFGAPLVTPGDPLGSLGVPLGSLGAPLGGPMSDYAYKTNAFLMIPLGVHVRLGCPCGAPEGPGPLGKNALFELLLHYFVICLRPKLQLALSKLS